MKNFSIFILLLPNRLRNNALFFRRRSVRKHGYGYIAGQERKYVVLNMEWHKQVRRVHIPYLQRISGQ